MALTNRTVRLAACAHQGFLSRCPVQCLGSDGGGGGRQPGPRSLHAFMQAFSLLGQLEDVEDVDEVEVHQEAPQQEPQQPRMPPRPVRVRRAASAAALQRVQRTPAKMPNVTCLPLVQPAAPPRPKGPPDVTDRLTQDDKKYTRMYARGRVGG